jgi:hypothetical protein
MYKEVGFRPSREGKHKEAFVQVWRCIDTPLVLETACEILRQLTESQWNKNSYPGKLPELL